MASLSHLSSYNRDIERTVLCCANKTRAMSHVFCLQKLLNKNYGFFKCVKSGRTRNFQSMFITNVQIEKSIRKTKFLLPHISLRSSELY